MAKRLKTDTAIKRAPLPKGRKTAATYPAGTTDGLTLKVTSKGRRVLLYRYRFDRKCRAWTLGEYPRVDLKTADKKARWARDQLDAGRDPQVVLEAEREAERLAELSAAGSTLVLTS